MGRLRPLILNENFARIRNEELGIRNEGGGFAANIYGRCPKVCDGRFPSYRQPSPRGEGAPKGRIGHWRYERERGNASQVRRL